jgi:glycosyltransferase involved in cell wall biosynthesis
MSNIKSKSIILSVLVSAHNEDLIAVKTIKSIKRSLDELDQEISYEVIFVLDKPTSITESVFDNQNIIKNAKIIKINEGELSKNRIAGINAAKGKYIAIIDADDLCSKNWFKQGLKTCMENINSVVHTEYSINFGAANIFWKKTNSKDIKIESLYNVQANRWDSALIAPKDILEKYQYRPNLDGFGSEDWDFNMRSLYSGIKHLVAPDTILFVRRRENGSEMAKQKYQRSIVRPSDMLGVSNFKNISENDIFKEIEKQKQKKDGKLNNFGLKIFGNKSLLARSARLIARNSKLIRKIRNKKIYGRFPEWLINEWKSIHTIDKEIFPSIDVICNMSFYDAEQVEFGAAYAQIMKNVNHDSYDYVVFVPYLNRGGADLVAIKYANAVLELSKKFKVCVIATEDVDSEWKNMLKDGIDFVPFGQITSGMGIDAKLTILSRFLANIYPKCIHIINSSLAYDYVSSFNKYLNQNDIKIIVCAFCEDQLANGHVMGYIHTKLPQIYSYVDKIFTDNMTIIKSLCDEYGYDKNKFSCHYISVKESDKLKTKYTQTNKIVWASRIAFQKQPHLLVDIAKKMAKNNPDILIHVYGSFDKNINKKNI